MASTPITMQSAMPNLDPEERDKFAALAASWWELDGPCRTLHDINSCRLSYIAACVSLRGARLADIGCGGGILSEALAQAGAEVVGIDASPELIEVARRHAATTGVTLTYQLATAEMLAATQPGSFDAVICMELIEHVPDAAALLADCARLLRPGGILMVSTLNRTLAAYVFGIVIAEYALALLPRGTHDHTQFIKPSELAGAARQHGLTLLDVTGMRYNPALRKASLSRSTAINYFASFTRGEA